MKIWQKILTAITVLLFSAIAVVGFLSLRSDFVFPSAAPKLSQTYTPITRSTPKGIDSYDVLGKVIDADRAAELLATDAGKQQLSPENGAVKITQELLDLGRKAFYTETFGNEYFITNVTGAIDGALNPFSISKAVLALGGKPTNNLKVSVDRNFRLPASGVNPLTFFKQIDPTPGVPGINKVEKMPGYPKGSVFMLDGLIAGSIGMPFGEQLNAMSAWQNTLAPPPYREIADAATLEQGQKVFDRAGCITCHSGRYFTNHDVIPLSEIGTQPSRTKSLFAFKNIFEAPRTYPNSVTVPVPSNSPILEVPTEITPEHVIKLAYGIDNSEGGYKVASTIGLHVTAPYLHDGGVAASAIALEQQDDGFYRVAKPDEIGMAGTLMRQIPPDPASSLRVLLDRDLRKEAILSNRQDPRLQKSNVEGIGHEYWIDKQAGFSAEEQNSSIEFLLSLDDEPDLISNQIANTNIRQRKK
jgi:Di-haem oxidoreductase, putative peroxidase